MISALIITHRGIEDITVQELKMLGVHDVLAKEGEVQCSLSDIKSLCSTIYQLRSASKVYLTIASWNDVFPPTIDFSFLKDKTFVVEGENKKEVGACIIKKTNSKVSFANPDFSFIVRKDTHTFTLYLDIAGIDLSKRDYRVFLGPSDLKGNLAYALLQIAQWTPSKILLDPFCQAGTIVIEAALASLQKPVAYHLKKKFTCNQIVSEDIFSGIDKQIISQKVFPIFASDPHFKHVSATQKNAKIAQVNKCITFTRQDTDWIDVKFKHKSIDCIVTSTPLEKDMRKEDIKLLFVRAKKILNKQGTITIITKTKQQEILQAAKEYVLKEQRTIWQGQAAMTIFVFALSK